MMKDFFKTQEEQLWDWMNTMRFIRTSEIIRWGTQNYCNGADRIARRIAKKEPNKLRRLKPREKLQAGFKTAEGIYEVYPLHII